MNKIKTYTLALISGLTLGFLIQLSPISSAYSVDLQVVDELEQTLICSLEATHIHAYTNESGPTDGIEYWARTNKFRIYLHDDFMSNVDLDTLECSSGGRWISCDGGTSTSDGGTSVEFVQNDRSSDAVYPDYVEWTYGNTTASDSPIMPGYNDYDQDGDIDTSPESDRTMGEYLTYDFIEDDSGKASTTSSIYIKFWAYDIEDDTWTAIEEDGETDYHWNNHTGTNITNYTCPAAGCALMTITPDEVGVDNLYTSTDFEVTAYDSEGTDITADLEDEDGFDYTATGEGAFKYLWTTRQTLSGADATQTYKKAGAGDSFTVEAVGYEDTCKVEIAFPYCEDLTVNEPIMPIFSSAPYTTDIDIDVTASNGEVWPFDITYTSDDSDATFDGETSPYTTTETNVAYSSSVSAQVDIEADHDDAGLCKTNFSYTITEEETPDQYCTLLELERIDSTNCWTYDITNSQSFQGTLYAEGYTDSTGTTLATSKLKIDSESFANPASSTLQNLTSDYSGKICWPEYEVGNYLKVYVEDEDSCLAEYVETIPAICNDIEVTPSSGNCWTYELNNEADFNGTLCAAGYTDNTKATTNGTITIYDEREKSVSGNEACVELKNPKSIYEGSICWPEYVKGNYLDVYVEDQNMCLYNYEDTTPEEETPGETSGGPGAPTNVFGNGGGVIDSPGIELPDSVITIVYPELSGTLSKYVYTFNFADQKKLEPDVDRNMFPSHDLDYAFYTLEYDPEEGESYITFGDDMWINDISGYFGNSEPSSGSVKLLSDTSELSTYESTKRLGLTDALESGSDDIGNAAIGRYWIPYISNDNGNKTEIFDCTSYPDNVCYNLDYNPVDTSNVLIQNADLLNEDEVIRIRYVGRVHQTEGLCEDEDRKNPDGTTDACLTETFDNNGYVIAYGGYQGITAQAKIVVLCQYIVTRNAGDVYLDDVLPSGSDISCINWGEVTEGEEYANIEGIIVNNYSIDTTAGFCNGTDSSSDNFISNLSSYVCEIFSTVSEIWDSATITEITVEHVYEEVRNAETIQTQQGLYNHSFNSWKELQQILSNQNNLDSGILYYLGTGETDVITLNSKMEVEEGAWTLIVENATLRINEDIVYLNNTYESSIAFIVINGDIDIGVGAEILNGVYYTDQGFTGDWRSPVTGQLTIYGSIYGDVSELLTKANYVGSPNLDGGGIVVYYDSRILLNTPPGLAEYVDVNSEQAVN